MRSLFTLLLIYAAASLLHFAHNAEFLAAYPNLPESWSRGDVYLAWVGVTGVGAVGWVLLRAGRQITGLLFLAAYAALGLDSLGHYALASPSEHTAAMNWTIMLEVCAAGIVLFAVITQLFRRMHEAR